MRRHPWLQGKDREEVNSTLLVWTVSIALEVVLLAVLVSRRAYTVFCVYMALDIVASVSLYAIADAGAGKSYDIVWRLTQFVLLAPRAAVAMDVYRSMSATRQYWRFADVSGIPLAACAALVFRLAQDAPLRWPWSSLEQVFIAVATFNFFLAMLLLTILTAKHRHSLIRTEDFWHGALVTGYLAVTSLCYYGIARYSRMGFLLMCVATAFYGGRLLLSFAAAPATPNVDMPGDWATEERR